MKRINIFIFILLAVQLYIGCTSESSPVSFDEAISTSSDTLRFDTVFTTAGSVTQTLKIFNQSNQPLRFESIQLGGGNLSSFQINVNGKAGPVVESVTIPANDSIYIFVAVHIDPNNLSNPFLVTDSIKLIHTQKIKAIQLRAYGQNAVYLKNEHIKTNTTWTSKLPYVIEGSLWIETGATLTIEKGSRIHVNASAPIIVDGTIKAIGTKKDSICFQGDRLDKDYRELPGSWPGIYFRNTSSNNMLKYVFIKHAYQGIVVGKKTATFPKLLIEQTIIDNCYETGLSASGSSIQMNNTLIRNCGSNILINGGGEYDFNHCTIVGYSTPYIPHKKSVLFLANWDSTTTIQTSETKAIFKNSVFWGESNLIDEEIQVSRKGNAPFELRLENCLYKSKSNSHISGLQNITDQPPLFDSIDAKGSFFDFHITKGRSPLINKGRLTGLMMDLDGNLRDNQPDIGCYEKQ